MFNKKLRRTSKITEENKSTPTTDCEDIDQITQQFSNIKTNKMAELGEIKALLVQMQQEILLLKNDRQTYKEEVNTLRNNLNELQKVNTLPEHEDNEIVYTSGEQVELRVFSEIPTFSGNRDEYQSWRDLVSRCMKQIDGIKTHPKYNAALTIVRTKVSGLASKVLINNGTKFNINAILDRLDYTYCDQRPMYVIEAEMTSIRQQNKSLQDYYDTINQALNILIMKIKATHKNEETQKSIILEAEQKAMRAFITGLTDPFTKQTLYSNTPKTLMQTFAIAQTIFHDTPLLSTHIPHINRQQNQQFKRQQGLIPYQFNRQHNVHPNFNPRTPQNVNNQQNRAEPMEIDPSKQFVQQTRFNNQQNYRYHQNQSTPNPPIKRMPSNNNFQQIKQQRVNIAQAMNDDTWSTDENIEEQQPSTTELDDHEAIQQTTFLDVSTASHASN